MIFIVESGQPIQAAIDSAKAGDTILVRPGVFGERLVVGPGKDRLRIIGAGPTESTIDGSGLGCSHGITVNGSDFVTLAGFTITGFDEGGVLVTSNRAVIHGNLIRENGRFGVQVIGSGNLVRKNTVVDHDALGIEIAGGTRNFIIANHVARSQGPGIRVQSDAPYTLILDNYLLENDKGLALFAPGSWVLSNRLSQNQVGIELAAVNPLLYGNVCTGSASEGLVGDVRGLVAIKNKLLNNGTHGVAVRMGQPDQDSALADSLLYANQISYNSAHGVSATPSLIHSLLLCNSLDGNSDDGLFMGGGDSNRVLFNTAKGNLGPGVHADPTTRANVIDDNQVHGNFGSGIRMSPESLDNWVRSNTMQDNLPHDLLAEPPADSNNRFHLNEYESSVPPDISNEIE